MWSRKGENQPESRCLAAQDTPIWKGYRRLIADYPCLPRDGYLL